MRSLGKWADMLLQRVISSDMQATILKSSSLYKTGGSSDGTNWYNTPSMHEIMFNSLAVQSTLGQALAGQPVTRPEKPWEKGLCKPQKPQEGTWSIGAAVVGKLGTCSSQSSKHSELLSHLSSPLVWTTCHLHYQDPTGLKISCGARWQWCILLIPAEVGAGISLSSRPT